MCDECSAAERHTSNGDARQERSRLTLGPNKKGVRMYTTWLDVIYPHPNLHLLRKLRGRVVRTLVKLQVQSQRYASIGKTTDSRQHILYPATSVSIIHNEPCSTTMGQKLIVKSLDGLVNKDTEADRTLWRTLRQPLLEVSALRASKEPCAVR